MGVALVFKGFDAPLHKHKEKETYFFVYGTGKMHLGGKGKKNCAVAVFVVILLYFSIFYRILALTSSQVHL